MKTINKCMAGIVLVGILGLGTMARPGGRPGSSPAQGYSEKMKEFFKSRNVPDEDKDAMREILAGSKLIDSGQADVGIAKITAVIDKYDRGVSWRYHGGWDSKNLDRDLTDSQRAVMAIGLSLRGAAYEAKKDWNRAFDDYDLALYLSPKPLAELLYSRALCHFCLGKYDAAAEGLNQLFAMPMTYDLTTAATTLRGDIAVVKQNYSQAVEDFSEALRRDPANESLRAALAQAREKLRQAADVTLAAINKATASKDDEVKKLAAALGTAKDAKTKIGILSKRAGLFNDLGRYAECEADCTAVLQLDPKNTAALKLRAQSRKRLQNPRGAAEDYSEYLKLKPEDTEILIARGQAYDQARDYARAVDDFSRVLTRIPNAAPVMYLRARARTALGDLQAALEDLNAAVAANPKMPEYFQLRSDVYSRLELRESALKDADSALALDPEDPELLRLRGLRYRESGAYEKSLADFDRALALDPEYLRVQGDRGDTLLFKGDYAQAIQAYTAFLGENPGSILGHYRRGQACAALKRRSEAAADFRATIELAPKDPAAYNSLAWILATAPDKTLRNGAEALDLARRATDLAADNYLYIDTLAAALAETGSFADAAAWQEKALTLMPQDADEKERKEMTARLALYKRSRPYRDK